MKFLVYCRLKTRLIHRFVLFQIEPLPTLMMIVSPYVAARRARGHVDRPYYDERFQTFNDFQVGRTINDVVVMTKLETV